MPDDANHWQIQRGGPDVLTNFSSYTPKKMTRKVAEKV